jgi:NadR type nicotinamide-nucleotide adenylyltransferase
VVGAESSGTTTLARALAAHYDTVWVPEYGREYWEQKMAGPDRVWRAAEFVAIAREQARREDAAAREANRLLVCDTDAFATVIWHERYVGRRSAEVEAARASRPIDLYLLTDIDIPFVQDGTRDGEHIRAWMHGRFRAALEEQGRPFAVVSGAHAERLRTAVDLIDARVLRKGVR